MMLGGGGEWCGWWLCDGWSVVGSCHGDSGGVGIFYAE